MALAVLIFSEGFGSYIFCSGSIHVNNSNKDLIFRLSTQFTYQNSKLLAPVVCFNELVYGPFGQSSMDRILNFCPDQTSLEGIKHTKAKKIAESLGTIQILRKHFGGIL